MYTDWTMLVNFIVSFNCNKIYDFWKKIYASVSNFAEMKFWIPDS